jgi:peptidoglycan/xylan/chitin deacetylase (PgdA/CDA1 family)
VSHPVLTALAPDRLAAELGEARAEIEARTGRTVRHFAAPYGRTGARERAAVGRLYETGCGTRLGRAGPADDVLDLPRLEMHYFRDPGRWRAHLAGRGGAFLAGRQALRAVRGLLAPPPGRAA